MKKKSKNRLFIVGDSWAHNLFREPSWCYSNLNPMPILGIPYHFSDYLENHYEVHNRGFGGVCNNQIIYQLGNMPKFKKGDRLIIILTHHSRFNIWDEEGMTKDFGDFSLQFVDDPKSRYCPSEEIQKAIEGRIRLFLEAEEEWVKGIRGMRLRDEMNFFKKLQHLYSDYKPIVCTWDETITKLTDVDYIGYYSEIYDGMKLTIADEYGLVDGHLGGLGNYLLYKAFLNRLDGRLKPMKQVYRDPEGQEYLPPNTKF